MAHLGPDVRRITDGLDAAGIVVIVKRGVIIIYEASLTMCRCVL